MIGMGDEIKRLLNKNKANKDSSVENKASDADPKNNIIQAKKQSTEVKPQPLKLTPVKTVLASLLIVLAGTLTGFGLSRVTGSGSTQSSQVGSIDQATGQIVEGEVRVGDSLGSDNRDGDQAEGVLQVGGINGEGSHRILRPGGADQTVYLTSSVVDLNLLEGHKVRVWGDTFAAQTAGWLMDVVSLEVLELDAPLPFEEE